MPEYIKREVAINRIKEYASDVYGIDLDDANQFSGYSLAENYCEGLYEATELIDDMPAADVAPVVHGRWAPFFDENDHWRQTFCKCSNCGQKYYVQVIKHYEYCPRCGAKMDGGVE